MNKKWSVPVVLSAFLMSAMPAAQAQPVRVFVSSLGKDNSACESSEKPCRSLGFALSAVAAGGEVVVLDSGNYQPVMIDKAVSVVAAPGAHPGMTVSSGAGVLVNGGPNDVVLIRGLRISSLGGARGIHFQSGAALHVENCLITGFVPIPSDCCTDGILVTANSKFFVKDTVVSGNFNGIRVFEAFAGLIQGSTLENNANGLWAEDDARVTIGGSAVTGNGSGITAFINADSPDSGPSEISVEDCLVAGNSSGIFSTGKPGDTVDVWTLVRVSNTTVTNNGQGVGIGAVGSAVLLSRGNNTVEGNDDNGAFTGLFAAK